jgi:S-(hydroxymethyl)glutathione dehydrogenase / alcohol dehydrogenase
MLKAAVLRTLKAPLTIEAFDLPEPARHQVLVKLAASGVCHSDWHVIKGDWPHIAVPTILGHEGAGVVEAVGSDVRGIGVGDHVVLSWKRNCGICAMCQQGFPNLCDLPPDEAGRPFHHESLQPMDKMLGLGTFATHTIVPADVVIPIDKTIPLQQAALVGCGVLTGVGAVVNTAQVEAGRGVAVFGCGGVGLNCIQGAALAGAEPIIAVDIFDSKLALARHFGATHTLNARQVDVVAQIQGMTGGGVHYAFEAVGLAGETFLQAILCTRKRGTTVFVGHAPFNTSIPLDARMLMHEKIVMGSYYGTARPHVDISRFLNLYKSGRLKLDELVSRTYPLEGVNAAFEALGAGEVARSVLVFE